MSNLRTVAAGLLAAALLAGCGPSLTPQPLPTPQILVVQVTPALQSLSPYYHGCMAGLDGAGLVINELPAGALDPSAADLALRWSADGAIEGYAAELGLEELVVVVHPSSAASSISLADLRAIYTGELSDWPAGSAVEPWTYPTGEDIQAVFEGAVLEGAPVSGRVASLAPDPAAMLEAVSTGPSAIGYLPLRWVNDSVKVLDVDGADPGLFRQPLVAISLSEPQGAARRWLVCLQEQLARP